MIGSHHLNRLREGELFHLWMPGPIRGILPQTVLSYLVEMIRSDGSSKSNGDGVGSAGVSPVIC
jgi:hypothetical protein